MAYNRWLKPGLLFVGFLLNARSFIKVQLKRRPDLGPENRRVLGSNRTNPRLGVKRSAISPLGRQIGFIKGYPQLPGFVLSTLAP